MKTPLTEELPHSKFSIRLVVEGFLCADGQRKQLKMFWSVSRVAFDHEYEMERCRDYWLARQMSHECVSFTMTEFEDPTTPAIISRMDDYRTQYTSIVE